MQTATQNGQMAAITAQVRQVYALLVHDIERACGAAGNLSQWSKVMDDQGESNVVTGSFRCALCGLTSMLNPLLNAASAVFHDGMTPRPAGAKIVSTRKARGRGGAIPTGCARVDRWQVDFVWPRNWSFYFER